MQTTASQSVSPSRLGLASRVLLVALWAGLMTGLVEALWLWFNQAIRGRVIFTSDYILWMTPLFYAMLFVGLGVIVALAAVMLHRRFRLGYAVFLFVAFGIACLFIPITQIARWAAAIVALGAGVQAAKSADAHGPAFWRFARRSFAVLAVSAGVAQVVSVIRGGSVTPGEPERTDLPNIVLIVWDTVRSESLSLHGYEEPTTPGLERLAAQSVVFDRAISPSPWTLPSHGSMFTGRMPHELSAGWLERLDDEFPTLAERLASSGYATGGFIANHHYTSYDSGLDRGFAEYGDYRPTLRQFLLSSWFTQTGTGAGILLSRSPSDLWNAIRRLDFWVGVKRVNHRKNAEVVNGEMFDWLDDVEDRPFFAFLNYFDAHAAYWSPPGTVERFNTADPLNRLYDAAISYLDSQVMALVDELRARGQLDDTIIVVTSDHGELFGENGLNGHAHNLYYRTIHVPLVVYAPGRFSEGRRVETDVSIRDLPATLLDLAGLPRGEIGGSSLAPHWEAAANGLPPIESEPLIAEVEAGRNNPPDQPISRGAMRAVLYDGFHYILNGDGVEELYNYLDDSREEDDLIADAESQEVLSGLKRALRQSEVEVAGNDR